jgi:hypothetical protein
MIPKNLTQDQEDHRKTFAVTSWNESQKNRLCLKMSPHVMKRGFFNMIEERRGNRFIRRHPLHREWKSKNEQVESEGDDGRFLRPEGQTVNQKYYSEVLFKLRERVRNKRQELWKKKQWILAHKCIPVLEHPAIQYQFEFPKVKSALKVFIFRLPFK